MSDNWLMFIPADPNVLPTAGAAENAAQLLRTFLPDAYGEGCGHATTLNDLNYVWPAGFSRFVLKAMNPNIRQTTSEQDEALSRALGFALRKVRMHI